MSVRVIAGGVLWLVAACCALAGEAQVAGIVTHAGRIALPDSGLFPAVLGPVVGHDSWTIVPDNVRAVPAGVADALTGLTSSGMRSAIAVELPPVTVRTGRAPGEGAAVVQLAAEGDAAADDAAEPPMRGLVTYLADAARFTDCRTGESFPIAMEEDYQALEHAYLAAGQEPGAPLMASFDGSIVERPRMDGGGTGPAVLVVRFVGIWPGEECEPRGDPASLTDTYWRIVRLGDQQIPAGDYREPHLLLRPADQRFVATVGCNQLVGGFELAGEKLMFGPAAATRMACPPPLDAWEQQLGWVLSATAGWQVDDHALELYDAEGAALATLRAVYLP